MLYNIRENFPNIEYVNPGVQLLQLVTRVLLGPTDPHFEYTIKIIILW